MVLILKMELIITKKDGTKHTVLYDECDHELISKYRWKINSGGYANSRHYSNGKEAYILMHRLILGITDPKIEVDHKKHNKLDNRRSELRVCTRSENMKNKKAFGKSKYLGVSYNTFISNGTRYTYIVAQIRTSAGECIKIRGFDTEEDAARHYDKLAKMHHGEFANLNFKE